MKNQLFFSLFACICLIFTQGCKKPPIIEEDEDPIGEVKELPVLDESIPAVIPHIYIDIDGHAEVVEKSTYLNAAVKMDGKGKFADLQAVRTRIKGRGNSTWNKPKKPYRLKLDEATAVLGLPQAKDWVLLANYNDYTFMANAIAMQIAKQLGMPYTNDIIPVDLTINGEYRGQYNLTQQIEAKANRVNVGEGGVIWELDSYFDEDWKFKSNHFNLPLMLKDPGVESAAQFEALQKEFQDFEDIVFRADFPNNEWGTVFDKEQLVNFLIVNNLTANLEISHPKSTFMHKRAGGKYTMGPIWDFDYGFGFDEVSRRYFNNVRKPLLGEADTRIGAVFFKHLLKDPEVRALYKSKWKTYRNTKFNELMGFIDRYAATVRNSQKEDFALWKSGEGNFAQSKADIKTFLRNRVKHIDSEMAAL